MKVIVNGIPRSYKGIVTVSTVLREMKAARKRVAVLVNGEVLGQAGCGSRVLKNNDAIEILTCAAGG